MVTWSARSQLMAEWCRRQPITGLSLEIARLPGRTPLIFIEVPGTRGDTVLLYGHLDKQPEFTGWQEGLGPWEPVIRDGRLYGRGAADDGYADFSSLTAIAALQAQQVPHARCVVLIEACEESGSFGSARACRGARARESAARVSWFASMPRRGDYERLWLTTSLRGNIVGTLDIEVLTEGVHSGAGSGIAAVLFRCAARSCSHGSRMSPPAELKLDELKVRDTRGAPPEIAATAKAPGGFGRGTHAVRSGRASDVAGSGRCCSIRPGDRP